MSVTTAPASRPLPPAAPSAAGHLARSAVALLTLLFVVPVAAAHAEDGAGATPEPSATSEPVRAIAAPKAVIELFTSQGCSSCPPADKLLGEIADRRDVIALTLAVDYWDYLGWKDTLAKHGHSLRQKAYAHMRGDGKLFTPQVVVNGRVMMVGSDRPALERALESIAPPAVPVRIESADGKVKVEIGAAPGSPKGEVWLCPVASHMAVDISRGENEGASMTYHNVVRGWTRLGEWEGSPARFEAKLPRLPGDPTDAVVVFVQSGSSTEPGAILGAALQPLD